MKILERAINAIKPLDEEAMAQAQARQDNLAKPTGSLGVLEDIVKQLAGITQDPMPFLENKYLTVFAGDHGVTEEGVSTCPKEVTQQMITNFIKGGAAINVLCRHAGATVEVVDVGVAADITIQGIRHMNVKKGTDNFTKGPAMNREEAIAAIEVGIRVALEQTDKGAQLLATGDMGIGNTTPSTAILCAFTDQAPSEVTGKGTGLNAEGILNKIRVIEKGLALNQPDASDPIDVLAKVGGLEIGGIAGYIIGAASMRRPVIVDGFISSAGALIAAHLAPQSINYMLASHSSEEPGHNAMLKAVGITPPLNLRMRLGEGTGGALTMTIVDAACKIQREMATFADAGVSKGCN